MKVPEGDFIKLVYEYNLHTQEGFEKQLTKNRWKEDLLDHLVDSNGDPIAGSIWYPVNQTDPLFNADLKSSFVIHWAHLSHQSF